MDLSIIKKAMSYPAITVRQLAVLFYLSEHGSSKIRIIACELRIPPAATTRALNGLDRMKLARRARDRQGDARDVFAILTSSGVQFVSNLMR